MHCSWFMILVLPSLILCMCVNMCVYVCEYVCVCVLICVCMCVNMYAAFIIDIILFWFRPVKVVYFVDLLTCLYILHFDDELHCTALRAHEIVV